MYAKIHYSLPRGGAFAPPLPPLNLPLVRDKTHKYAFTPPFKPNPWFELSLGYERGGHMLLSQNVFAGATVDNWGQWHFVLLR